MAAEPTLLALVPARAGSQRVPGKNLRPLAGHPLLAYAIATALRSGLVSRVVVSTDSEETAAVARRYGAEVPFLRPAELATATAPDIAWLADLFDRLDPPEDAFALLRPTSPFRGPDVLRAAWREFLRASASTGADSLRAVEACRQHPGKMWRRDGELLTPLLDQAGVDPPWHSRQYQDLPEVLVQNSSLEIAWARVVREQRSLAGRRVAPFFAPDPAGFSIDYPDDWERAEHMVATGGAVLPDPEP